MMASIQQNSEPSSNNNDNDLNAIHPIESPEAPQVQDSVELETPTAVREALSKAAFVLYICTTLAYIFLSAPRSGEDQGRFSLARLVVFVVWMVNSGVLFLCHAHYLIRHKREIASAFFVSAVGMHFLVGSGGTAITDGIGVVMLCIVIAALCPGLLGPLGMMSPP